MYSNIIYFIMLFYFCPGSLQCVAKVVADINLLTNTNITNGNLLKYKIDVIKE